MVSLAALLAACTEVPSPAGTCELPAVPGERGRVVGFTEAHNAIRREVGVPELTWDPALAEAAADWLHVLVTERDCALDHNLASPLGENLGWNRGFENNPCHVVDEWAEEEADWDYASGTCQGECGHWTQLVWSTTERVGCAMDRCADGGEIWMCTYDPPGNVPGVAPF